MESWKTCKTVGRFFYFFVFGVSFHQVFKERLIWRVSHSFLREFHIQMSNNRELLLMKLPLNSKRLSVRFFFNTAITYIEITFGKFRPTLMKSTNLSRSIDSNSRYRSSMLTSKTKSRSRTTSRRNGNIRWCRFPCSIEDSLVNSTLSNNVNEWMIWHFKFSFLFNSCSRMRY